MPCPMSPTSHNIVRPSSTPSVGETGAVTETGSSTTSTVTAEVQDSAATYSGTNSGAAEVPANALPIPAGAASVLATRLAAMGGADAMTKALKTKAGRAQLAAQLQGLLSSDPASAAVAAKVEKQVIGMVTQANAAGQLPQLLTALAEQVGGPLEGVPEEKKQGLILQLSGMIDAELQAHGMTPQTAGVVYKDWAKLSQEHLALIHDSQVAPAGPGSPSALKNPTFVAELEQLMGAKFSNNNEVVPLIDGPASFAARKKLIEGASESIHMLSWAFYDDETGWDTAKMLAAKAEGNPPVDVKIMVDGQVADRPGHNATLDYMQAHGVQIVRWRDAEHPYNGQHRKSMVVDGEVSISGGMNVGNDYSHMGPADAPKWRDTDLQMRGAGAADGEALFAQLWNQQVSQHQLSLPTVDDSVVAAAREKAKQTTGSAQAAVVNHVPGSEGDAHILLATLKAIEGATERIDIENAYFISTPALNQALLDALDRGVQVRILTNSAESVDEPIVTVPILQSLPGLAEKGAEIYLKTGDTLHSKFLVADGEYASVGSYNLHPRSHRYEGEMTVNVLDEGFAQKMDTAFETDISVATALVDPQSLEIPRNLLSTLAGRYFFDQL